MKTKNTKAYDKLVKRFTMNVNRVDYSLFLAWWEGIPAAHKFNINHKGENVVEVSLPQPWKPWSGEVRVNHWRDHAENWHAMVVRGIAGQKVRIGNPVNCSVGVWPTWR